MQDAVDLSFQFAQPRLGCSLAMEDGIVESFRWRRIRTADGERNAVLISPADNLALR